MRFLFFLSYAILFVKERSDKGVEAMNEKQRIRQQVKQKTEKLSTIYLRKSEEDIQKQVLNMKEFKEAETVFCYISMGKEVSTELIIKECFRQGKRVGVPLCTAPGVMEVREITCMEQLEDGIYGLKEPKKNTPIVEKKEIDLGIIPCVSADLCGKRLGHGAGYYDRYLSGAEFLKVLLCRAELLWEEIPTDSYDVPMDLVITENR